LVPTREFRGKIPILVTFRIENRAPILQPLVDLRLQRRGAFRAILRLIANEGGDFAILTLQVADLTLKMFDLLVLVDGFTTTAEQLPDNQAKDTDGRHGDESYS